MSTSPKPEAMVIDQPEAEEQPPQSGAEQDEQEEEEEEEEEVAPRRSTRVRKPVIKAPAPKLDLGSDSDLSDAPVRRRRRRKSTAAKQAAATTAGENGEEVVSEPPPKRKRKRAAEPDQEPKEEGAEEEKGNEDEKPPPKKRAARKKKVDNEEEDSTAKVGNGEENAENGPAAPAPPKRKRAPKKPKEEGEQEDTKMTSPPKETVTEAAPNGDAEEPEKPKRVRKPKVKEPVVYVIPDVEKKTTTFRGRLGYACLNTVLRAQKPAVFSGRTCRIDTIQKSGMDHVKELGRQNVKDLLTMIEWNEKNNIRFMRMSSDMFPFASHATYGYDLSYCDAELKAVGELAKKYGHRLTSHPGQFTQIASPKENVVEASIKELEYHAEMMDRMGLDQDAVMIIHMGGVYGDKATTLARFKDNYEKKLSDAVKRRLVLENDEICYNVDDLLKVCPQLNIPIIFDYHHDSINPSRRPASELIPIINQTWQARGIKPKQHLSQAREGAVTAMELRAHADRCTELPRDLPDDMDLMIEAKDKEQAVFELYRIYDLHPVIWENLRPPSEDQGLKTKGRKSAGGKKMRKDQKDGIPVPETEEQTIDPEMIDELADDDDI